MSSVIVEHGLKIDLHIHSCFSSRKDGKKVTKNTINNLPLLIERLNKNQVNLCAITDHDAFSYDMYSELKKTENMNTSIQKVLPGVEFSVMFRDFNNDQIPLHVVTIFSDKDDTGVAHIESVLKSNCPKEDGGYYSEEDFLRILREINLDTILIVHQKNSLTSSNPQKNDANSLGECEFLELVASDYFEAYEFKNKRNEILNKRYLVEKGIENKVRFVTGSDCHDWSVYPKGEKSEKVDTFPYTYAKCLPTFRGLVMAMTDYHRLRRVDSFFNADKKNLEYIEINNNGELIKIPLSKGINVLIGDNSVGKSMLLHAMTGFEKKGEKLESKIKKGYQTYMKKKGLGIEKQLEENDVFSFDMQGEVRRKFEENRLIKTEFARYFPSPVNPQPYKTIVEREIERLCAYLERKFAYNRDVNGLGTFTLFTDDDIPESIIFEGTLRDEKSMFEEIDRIITELYSLSILYKNLIALGLDPDDKSVLVQQMNTVNDLLKKYRDRKQVIVEENERIDAVASAIDEVVKEHDKCIGDNQKKRNASVQNVNDFIGTLIRLLNVHCDTESYSPAIEKKQIDVSNNIVQQYNFISKTYAPEISSEMFYDHIQDVLGRKYRDKITSITEKELEEALKVNDGSSALSHFKNELTASFDKDFSSVQTIILKQSDKSEELSTGLNSKIYFDLLSYERNTDGIYIIDQPEDNVSQPAIKEYLLDCFKTMGENRQVILVTHNPQFVVNLDVDNLIFLSQDNTGKLLFKSGALEYECDEYSVLQLVADNIDGGLDSIQKRWKRYEKTSRV